MSTNKFPGSGAQKPGVLPFTPDKYLHHLDDCDLSETQKTEFLSTVWEIMSTFVRLGFGVDSVLPALFQASALGTDALEETIPTHEFNVAAGDDNNKEES